MKRRTLRVLISILLLTGILFSLGATAFAGSMDDGAAFGTRLEAAAADTRLAWVDRADEDAVGEKINAQTLYPQRTGWKELDEMMEDIFSQAGEDADAHTKLKYAYDYLVKQVTYSWEGYSYTVASVACYNSVNGYDYLSRMTYEEGLQKSIPDDMANRTYHILKDKKGVCYDYAIAIAVMARYLGLNAYVETGLFVFEDTSLGAGHHGWALVDIGDETYIFDPQRDARNYQYFGRNGYYYGIPYETGLATNYRPSYYAADVTANQQRRDQMLPVEAQRAHQITVSVSATEGGTVTGGGKYITGDPVTLTAVPEEGYLFTGWYDGEGNLIADSAEFSFTADKDLTLEARFAKTVALTLLSSRSGTAEGGGTVAAGSAVTISAQAVDAPFEGWYLPDGTLVSSEAEYALTVGEDMTLIAMFEGDKFYDIPKNAWYAPYAVEACENGLIQGTDPLVFGPEETLTRGMLVTILANMSGADTSSAAPCPFQDVSKSRYYYDEVCWAYQLGIVKGTDKTHFSPDAPITREQILAMVVRYLDVIGVETEPVELDYTDVEDFSGYALPYARRAESIGLIKGYKDGSFRPGEDLPRSEGVTILVRLDRYLKAYIDEA